MSNEEIVLKIQSGEDDMMGILWEQIRDFVSMMANKYRGLAEYDDLMQEGYLSLYSAVRHWNVDAGTKFLSYAGFWIRQSMTRYIEHDSGLSISMCEKVRKLRKFRSDYEQECGRPPSDEETCHLLGYTEKELASIMKATVKNEKVSLDCPVGEDEESRMGDLIPLEDDMEGSVLDKVQHEELSNVIWKLVDDLPEKDAPEIMRRRYQNEEQLKNIAEKTGHTTSETSDIIHRGLRNLREGKNRKQLRPFYDDQIYSEGMRGCGVSSFNRTWTSSTERAAIDLTEK